MLESLQNSDFSAHLHEKFRIRTQSSELLEVELIEVSETGSAPTGGETASKRRPFSIVFRGPMEAHIPQNTYEIEHDKMGTISIFIVPIGPDGEGMRYEAVFS